MDFFYQNKPMIEFGRRTCREIAMTPKERELWYKELLRHAPTEVEKHAIERLREIAKDLDYSSPYKDGIHTQVSILRAWANRLDPFPSGEGKIGKERRYENSIQCVLAATIFNRQHYRSFENIYHTIFPGPEGINNEYWENAYITDAALFHENFRTIVGNTYLYLLLMELICSIPTKTDNRNSESEGGDTFIDLIERFPLYIHTDFAMKWMLLKRFSILKRNPDGLRAKNPEIYSLANALCGTPPTFRPRVKSTKPTPVGMTSDLSLFLMVGQNCNFKNYSKKADEEANRLLTELGMKMKNNEMMVKSWEEIKRKGSKKIRELAKLKLSGQKNIEPDNHFRLRWLSLLFEDIGPSTMGYLTGRYILYSEVISLPSSKEFVSVMNDVRYRTSANAT